MRTEQIHELILEAARRSDRVSREQEQQLRIMLLIRPIAARNAEDLVRGAVVAAALDLDETAPAERLDMNRLIELIMALLPILLKLFGL